MKNLAVVILLMSLLYSCSKDNNSVNPNSKVTFKVMFSNTYWTGYGYYIDTTLIVDRGAKYSTSLNVKWTGNDTILIGKIDINYFRNDSEHDIKISWYFPPYENDKFVVFINGICSFQAVSGTYVGQCFEIK